MFATLLLAAQSSLLVAPLHHGDEPPQPVAVAALRISDEPQRPGSALATARTLLAGLREPREFTALARAQATRRSSARSGVFGIHPPGMLAPEIEEALGRLAIGQVSAPLEIEGGALIVQRIEALAACRQIFFAGADDEARGRSELAASLLRGGADFAELARERSEDLASALRGGDYGVFERGPRDAAIREAAFQARVGEIVGPLATPLGFHIVQRVGVDAIDPRLREDNQARVRAILIAFEGAEGAERGLDRDGAQAEALANELAARIRRGEDMAELAREHTDDRGLRELGGDCGWVRRGVTQMPAFFDRAFVDPPGELIGPLASSAGFVLLRREDPGPRSRLDLRIDAFADMEQWVRALAETPDAPADFDGLEALEEALAAAAELDRAFGSPLEWGRLEGLLPQCANSADFVAHCERLPEKLATTGRPAVELRALALRFARALHALEPAFLERVWPEHARLLEGRAATLRGEFGQLADCAVEQLLGALGMQDPRVVAPIYLVAEAPRPGGVTHRTARGAACWIDVDAHPIAQTLEVVLHEAAHVFDVATHGQPTALGELRDALRRAGFTPSNRELRDAPHTAMFVASAWTVRTVLDPDHRDHGELAGYYGRVGRTAEVVRGPWTEFASGACDRRAAIERVVAGLRALEGGAVEQGK